MKTSTFKLTMSGMLAALSVLLVITVRFPLLPALQDFKYDPSDIPTIFGTLLFGPWYGLLMVAVTCIIEGVTVNTSGPIGMLMHFLASGSLVLAAGLVHRRKPGMLRLVIALVAGILTMTVTMVGWNLLISPYYYHTTLDVILGMLPMIVAFNLLKAAINVVLSGVLFKALSPMVSRRAGLIRTKS